MPSFRFEINDSTKIKLFNIVIFLLLVKGIIKEERKYEQK